MPMPTPSEVLALLRCPTTKQPLRAATVEEKRAQGIPENEEALASQDGDQQLLAELRRTALEPPPSWT